MIRRVVIEARADGQWSASSTDDAGAVTHVEGLASQWEAGQVAATLGEQVANPSRLQAKSPARRR